VEADVPIDMRVREVVVASPSTYGLAEKFSTAGTEFSYAWSDDVDRPPQATSMSKTRYPSEGGSDGLVLVRALLGTNGVIEDHEILCGASPFEDAARRSVGLWAFAPPTARGQPARVWMLLEFAFIKANGEAGFDPSVADATLESMRAQCAQQIAAWPR